MEQITMVPLEQLHPHEKNPRIDAASVADLVESIREHGIEVPLVATASDVDPAGWVVLAGHRRLTAAHELGLTEVPVQIRQDLVEARDQLAFMASENIHRDNLTVVEESRLVQDMLNLGMSQAEVARQTALGKKRVSERVKLGKLAEDTGEKVHRGQITVDDALVIAEYADDPEIVEELEEAVGSYQFDWKVSEARRRREDRDRAEASRKLAKKRGLRLVDGVVLLSELVVAGRWSTDTLEQAAESMDDDSDWHELLIIEHQDCPGHAATILSTSVVITGQGRLDKGTLVIGCDQIDEQHPATDTPATEESEPEPDPWDEISADDFATAKVHRERHLARHLPHLEVEAEAFDLAVDSVLEMGWSEYYNDEHGIDFLQAITEVEGKAKVAKVLRTYPIHVLIWIHKHAYELKTHHRMMGQGKQGATYWRGTSPLRQLLERTGYQWTPAEQQAILLATGIPHDGTDVTLTTDGTDRDGAALAEDGDAA